MVEVGPVLLEALPPAGREALMREAKPVEFPDGARIFREGQRADRFWVLRSGSVRLAWEIPLQAPVTVERLHRGELVGWSWLFPPHEWHFTARAEGHVTAWEFDAAAARELCDSDPEFGRSLVWQVARIVAHRLQTARMRLLHTYGPWRHAMTSEGAE